MDMHIGKTYHQEFQNGERVYVRIIDRFANGRFKALKTEFNRKPVQCSVDNHPSLPWRETPDGEIPKKLR
jgi:hypothetical protein